MSREDESFASRHDDDRVSLTAIFRRHLSVVGCFLVVFLLLFSFTEQSGMKDLMLRLVPIDDDSSLATSSTFTTAASSPQQVGTLVVYLSGQLGNHLHFVARGYGLQQYVAHYHNLDLQVVYYFPDNNNQEEAAAALTTKRQLEQAFPQTFVEKRNAYVIGSAMEHHETNDTLEVLLKRRMQDMNDWLGPTQVARMNQHLNSNSPDEWQHALSYVSSLTMNITSSVSLFPLPLLEMRSMDSSWFVNEYYDSIQTNLFRMDDDRVCANNTFPGPHEWVLHYRHFRLDVPHYYEALGFEELEPAALVESSLFDQVPNGTHVAIVGYKLDDTKPGTNTSSVQAMLNQSFIKHGLVPRFVTHHDHPVGGVDPALQDFCFLRDTQQTMVGTWRSTFFQWAAYLGSAHHVQLYVLDSPEVRARFGNDLRDVQQQLTNWTHPMLEGRFESPIIVKQEKGET